MTRTFITPLVRM